MRWTPPTTSSARTPVCPIPPGKLDGFGGKVEPGETIEQAALRELEEEACLQATALIKRGHVTVLMPAASISLGFGAGVKCW